MPIRSPFGAASSVALTATGAQTLTIDGNLTVIDGVSVIATGSRTLNLIISPETAVGTKLILKNKTTAAETTVMGTGMTGLTITGVAGKTFLMEFIYDGVTFKAISPAVQID
ncbi:MAG: hypothetical protein ABI241_00535 [Bacteroidia bacterium]